MSVLGIGNALVDILVGVDSDQVIAQLGIPRGSMQLVDEARAAEVLAATARFGSQMSSGGSAANTVCGVARLGMKAGFVGKTGADDLGRFFRDDMARTGVEGIHLRESGSDTGRAVALISPDGERTFATHLGAAVELEPGDLSGADFDGYRILHIEGYLVQNHALMRRAVELAKERGMRVSLDLASYNVVEQDREFLGDFVRGVDILFANEEESRAFTGLDPRSAVEAMGRQCPVAVVKVGKRGSLISEGGLVVEVPAAEATPRDTTGAGDLFAAGVLYGIARGASAAECGRYGSVLAGEVIEVMGAKIADGRWPAIREKIG